MYNVASLLASRIRIQLALPCGPSHDSSAAASAATGGQVHLTRRARPTSLLCFLRLYNKTVGIMSHIHRRRDRSVVVVGAGEARSRDPSPNPDPTAAASEELQGPSLSSSVAQASSASPLRLSFSSAIRAHDAVSSRSICLATTRLSIIHLPGLWVQSIDTQRRKAGRFDWDPLAK